MKFPFLAWLTVLWLAACDRPTSPVEPAPPPRFIYMEPPRPVATVAPEGMSRWIDALTDLSHELEQVRQKLNAVSTLHQQTAFDEMFKLDLRTLANDQLCYLWHFADKGYFTVEREIMLNILEERRIRDSVPTSTAANIAERAERLAQTYRSQLSELHLAIDLYEKTQAQNFTIPSGLDPEQIEVLRNMVAEKLAIAQSACEVLDRKIAELQEHHD